MVISVSLEVEGVSSLLVIVEFHKDAQLPLDVQHSTEPGYVSLDGVASRIRRRVTPQVVDQFAHLNDTPGVEGEVSKNTSLPWATQRPWNPIDRYLGCSEQPDIHRLPPYRLRGHAAQAEVEPNETGPLPALRAFCARMSSDSS